MKTRSAILSLLFAALAACVFWITCSRVFSSADDPRMIRFLRKYGQSPEAAERLVERGCILDCNGDILSAPAQDGGWKRDYPLGEAAAHPVGAFGPDPTGCERAFDETLSRPSAIDPSRGGSVALTIDAPLQSKAYSLLAGRAGAVVALDPRDGRILAAASSPGYDPANPRAAADSSGGCFVNRAFDGLYPPGSVFKIFTAAMAVDAGLENETLSAPAAGWSPAPGAPPVRDHEALAAARSGARWRGRRAENMENAFARSSNVYFARIACLAGAERFNATAERSCLRNSFSLAPGAASPMRAAGASIPPPENAADLAAMAIGQGRLQLSPLAVALLAATAANGGDMPAPTIEAEAPPRILARAAFSPHAAAKVKSMMRAAVLRGTARGCDIPGMEVCAKTGTAQTGSGGDHSWFVCFAPESAPQIVVAVVVEHAGFGAEAALPVAREMLAAARERGFVETGTGPAAGETEAE